MKSTVNIDIDCLVRQIYGMNDILASLSHADFQVRLRDALEGDPVKRAEFFESGYGILTGSLQTLSGAVEILADSLLNGDIDIVPSEPYRGLEIDKTQKDIISLLNRVEDADVMRKIYMFSKTLIEG